MQGGGTRGETDAMHIRPEVIAHRSLERVELGTKRGHEARGEGFSDALLLTAGHMWAGKIDAQRSVLDQGSCRVADNCDAGRYIAGHNGTHANDGPRTDLHPLADYGT